LDDTVLGLQAAEDKLSHSPHALSLGGGQLSRRSRRSRSRSRNRSITSTSNQTTSLLLLLLHHIVCIECLLCCRQSLLVAGTLQRVALGSHAHP
jgi:hypothetical protein